MSKEMKYLATSLLEYLKYYEKYPSIRIITTKKSYDSIINSGYIYSRKDLSKNLDKLDKEIIHNKGLDDNDDVWWNDRKENDKEKFNTENLIFATPDWFDDGGYETGHGPIMVYLKPEIFEDFKITLTEVDSLTTKKLEVYDKNDIKKIYSFIKNIDKKSDDKLYNVAKRILNRLDHKNENGFYDRYAEIQIHASKISTDYIDKILKTKNYWKG
jgi:hypothetical protein